MQRIQSLNIVSTPIKDFSFLVLNAIKSNLENTFNQFNRKLKRKFNDNNSFVHLYKHRFKSLLYENIFQCNFLSIYIMQLILYILLFSCHFFFQNISIQFYIYIFLSRPINQFNSPNIWMSLIIFSSFPR